MSNSNSFKLATLAASIALAMTSTVALAAAPTATQLPGLGTASGTGTVGTITTPTTGGAQTINISGNVVINWGKTGGTINPTQPGGFNIGSGASLTFAGQTTADAVLNIDVSNNPSQIFGALTGTGTKTNVFVANANGIIVGAGGSISSTGEVGLIANTLGATTGFTGDVSTISYNGTGGNVSVLTKASLSGSSVFVSGGGTVNVDLSTLDSAATLSAGLPQVGGSFATKNTSAVLAVSGNQGAPIVGFSSAGTASNSGSLTLASASVAGAFTNTGALYLNPAFTLTGSLVNQKTVNAQGAATFGSLTNSGTFNGNGAVTTTKGGLTNSGQISGVTTLSVTGGDLTNNGQISGMLNNVSVTDGNLTNNGAITLNGNGSLVSVDGGDVINVGSISANNGGLKVTNGSINNSGKLAGFYGIQTASDTDEDSFTAGADYSITNSGTISGLAQGISANGHYGGNHSEDDNDSIGSFTNTGVLALGAGGSLNLEAYSDVNLGGSVTAGGHALSATNTLSGVQFDAENGVLTSAVPLFFNGNAKIYGEQVKLLANVTGGAPGVWGSYVNIGAGDKLADDYAIRIGNGVAVTAGSIEMGGQTATDHPNVILQGTLVGNDINLGNWNRAPVSDIFSGPNGGIVAAGDQPFVGISFTGAIKTASYLNDANNFRYNYLPITVTGSGPVEMYLNPVAYQTNGTSNGLSAVNILVNGSVNLDSPDINTPVQPGDSAVTGVTNMPNTHLVLQSTGSIATTGSYYWPGYVYLGNIGTNANGAALPGTLGLGTIALNGNFSNVLPGDIAGASGIHFITQFPMTLGGNVITNANAWVNFGTDLLTQAYASGTLGANKFFGGAQGSGSVVNYGPLASADFATQAPSATP